MLDVTITPLAGQITGTHLLLELADATQRQRISRESDLLARLDSSRLMIRQLAHEIKNPLGGLRGAAQLLARELHDASLREYTGVIIGEADRLTALVDSIAGPGRPPQRSARERPRAVRACLSFAARRGACLGAARARLRPEPAERHARSQSDHPGAAQRCAQCAAGARRARRITLRTRALSNVSIGSVRHQLVGSIQVDDNGPGVPQELRASIFYPLVTGRANGTGLGLAVAQDLVTRHGGLIEFESEPGRTVFTLLLPLTEDA